MDEFQTQMFDRFAFEMNGFLYQLEELLMQIESGEAHISSNVNEIFRIMHTIKSSAAMIGFVQMSTLAHRMEDLFHFIRNEKPKYVQENELAGLLLKCIDYFQAVLEAREEDEAGLLVDDITNYLVGLKNTVVEVTCTEKNITQRRRDPNRQGIGMMAVPIKTVDQLVNLSGELVTISKDVEHKIKDGDGFKLHQELGRLHKIALLVQEYALALRMVTLADTFHNLKRSMRDMTAALGKKIAFTMSGEHLSMDKDIVNQLYAPLMHIIKNAIDHGIEMPGQRLAAGKAEQGNIHLSAQVAGKQVVIKVKDDGGGIDNEKVLVSAVSKGFVTMEQAQNMTADEIARLILKPGFSMKEEVSEYSGRGVGMDVVHAILEKLNGRIEIASQRGEGSVISLYLPLRLTMVTGST